MVRRSVFSKRGVEPPPPKPETVIEPPPFERTETPEAPRERQIDLSGWTYAGYFVLGGKEIGVVQSESSSSWEKLSVGERFLGAEVTEITGEAMRLRHGSRTQTLNRTDLFPVSPLDATAVPDRQPRPPIRR
jgi:hypothetical protein